MHQPSLALQRITESLAPPRHRSSTDEVFTEPQRLHKVLASCGFGSRRAMEEMILAGRITVNREPAEVGQKVGPGDEVRINGELVRVRFAEPRARILMYHKPAGEIVTRDDPEGRPTVFAKLPSIGNGKWIAIGRLDYNTEGLLLFTNSGELANKMMHPRYEVEREYAVRLMGTLSEEQRRALVEGIALEDGPAKVDRLEDGGGEGSNHWYHVVLKEGRNREVRRLFEALGLMVSRLIRTRFGSVAMPSRLKRGQTLELSPDEVGSVLATAGMKASAPSPKSAGRPHGKGQRPQGRGPQGVEPRGPRHDAPPPRHVRADAATQPDDGSDEESGDEHRIEPGNSASGAPTHGNTPVGRFFGKGHGRPQGHGHGHGGPRHTTAHPQHGQRGQGQAGQGRGGQGHGGQGHGGQGYGGQGYGGQGHGGQGHGGQGPGGRGYGSQGRGHGKPRHTGPAGQRQTSSPYVMTTLTVPGAVPEGLPGTQGARPKGPGTGYGPRGPGSSPGKKRGRDNRHRVAKPGAVAGGETTVAPAIVDDDIGNR